MSDVILAQVLATDRAWAVGVDIAVKATLLMVAALLLDRALRSRHVLACSSVWNACLIGLALLPLATLAFPRLRIECLPPQTAMTEASRSAMATETTHPANHLDMAKTAIEPIARTQGREIAPETPAERSNLSDGPVAAAGDPQRIAWRTWLLWAYVIGGTIVAVRLAFAFWTVGSLRRSSMELTDPGWIKALDRWCRELEIGRQVQLAQSERIDIPVVVGWLRPMILVPSNMVAKITPGQRGAILVHELAHVQRADVLWQSVLSGLQVVYWFHPLAWLSDRAIRTARERACDDFCVHWLGNHREYGTALIDLAARLIRVHRLALGLAVVRSSKIEQRLAHIDQSPGSPRCCYRRPTRTLLLGIAAALTILIGSVELARIDATAESITTAVEPTPPRAQEQPAKATDSGQMRVRVVDASGKPIADAKLSLTEYTQGKELKTEHACDADGVALFEVPKKPGMRLRVWAIAKGYVPLERAWGVQPDDSIPAEFTFTLHEGVPIGGIVHDEQGHPIPGARVAVVATTPPVPKEYVRPSMRVQRSETDTEGRWNCRVLPKDVGNLGIMIQHDDYLENKILFQDATLPGQLQKQEVVSVMQKGITVEGTVTDPNGAPVAGVRVVKGRGMHFSYVSGTLTVTGATGTVNQSAGTLTIAGDTVTAARPEMGGPIETDSQGKYRLRDLRRGPMLLTVGAPGLAPQLRKVVVGPDLGPVDFQLAKGRVLRVRVVDRDGKPVAGTSVSPVQWKASSSLTELALPKQTDEQGQWVWDGAPEDDVTFRFQKKGYMRVVDKVLRAQEEEHEISLLPPLSISGRVVDAQTKEPIDEFDVSRGMVRTVDSREMVTWGYRPAWFERVVYSDHPGESFMVGSVGLYAPDSGASEDSQGPEFTDGKYRVEFSEPGQVWKIRIEAAGYQPVLSRSVRSDEEEVTIDFELQAGQPVAGVVRLPDGKPAVGAEVVLCVQSGQKQFINGRRGDWPEAVKWKTDAEGRFSLSPQAEPYSLVVLDSQGFAEVEQQELAASGQITLRPWARLEGTVRLGNRPSANQMISMAFFPSVRPAARSIQFHYHTTSNAEGKFAFQRVIPGTGYVQRHAQLGDNQWISEGGFQVQFVAGRTTKLQLGGTGRTLVGRVAVPLVEGKPIASTSGYATLEVKPPTVPVPRDFHQHDSPQYKAWYEQWVGLALGTGYQAASTRHLDRSIGSPGEFRLPDVEAGVYQLKIIFRESRDASPGKPPQVWSAVREITVPETPDGRTDEPIDLGTLELKPEDRPSEQGGLFIIQ